MSDASPLEVRTVDSEKELLDSLRELHPLARPLVPRGGDTHPRAGSPPPPSSVFLDLTKLSGIVEHQPADLVATIRAGTPLGEAQSALKRERQRLRLDAAWPKSTLGGCVSVDAQGPRRRGWGTLRDLVLGARFVLSDARTIRSGGKVVKNVAGYDLTKLMIGSLGTLGILTEITLKVDPIPESERLFVCRFDSLEKAWAGARAVDLSPLEPVALRLLTGDEARRHGLSEDPAGPALAVGAEGTNTLVRAFGRHLQDSLGFTVDPRSPEETDEIYRNWERIFRNPEEKNPPPPIFARFGLRPKRLLAELSRLHSFAHQNRLAVDPSLGQGWIGLANREELVHLRSSLERAGGYAIVESTVIELASEDVWGRPRAEDRIVRSLKKVYDPDRQLNRGRYFGGL